MIAHTDAHKPVIQACNPSIRTEKPCFVTVRTLSPNGQYHYRRFIVRYGAKAGGQAFVTSFAP